MVTALYGLKALSCLGQAMSGASLTSTAPGPDVCSFYSVRRMVNETDIVELELKSKRFSLSLKKKAALAEPVVQVCCSCSIVPVLQTRYQFS